jgi:hypothetical protein
MQGIGERMNSQPEMLRRMMSKLKADLRVAMPGIVVAFNSDEQTVSVQPALREKLKDKNGNVTDVALPVLPDVPIVFPRAGGFALTMPVAPGDECLVIFTDMCIDSWWSSGGVQNQLELRRHDLSDAFAILGTWSQPNLIPNYNLTAAELRTLDGATRIILSNGEIDFDASTTKILRHGSGIALTSPDGTKTKTVTIDNSGNLVLA